MGRPKLLLPLGDRAVAQRLLDALSAGGVDATYLLVRSDDSALRDAAGSASCRVIETPRATQDMRESVELLLRAVRQEQQPQPDDAWLLCPADHPLVSAALVRRLLEAWRGSRAVILVPRHAGRRGHPTLFSWRLGELSEVPAGQGLNWLLREYAAQVEELEVDDPDVLLDLDAPADYERLLSRFERAE
jgi:molybdenum cofactor cytidylyltransferase